MSTISRCPAQSLPPMPMIYFIGPLPQRWLGDVNPHLNHAQKVPYEQTWSFLTRGVTSAYTGPALALRRTTRSSAKSSQMHKGSLQQATLPKFFWNSLLSIRPQQTLAFTLQRKHWLRMPNLAADPRADT